MKRLQQLTKEINELTNKIERDYPELYQHLNETPIDIPSNDYSKLDTKNFSEYLDSLKELLKRHIDTRDKKV